MYINICSFTIWYQLKVWRKLYIKQNEYRFLEIVTDWNDIKRALISNKFFFSGRWLYQKLLPNNIYEICSYYNNNVDEKMIQHSGRCSHKLVVRPRQITYTEATTAAPESTFASVLWRAGMSLPAFSSCNKLKQWVLGEKPPGEKSPF